MVKIVCRPPIQLSPLDTVLVGRRLMFYEMLDSTNAAALVRPRDGTVHVAESQRAGRGRHGRSWHSAPGLGLWFSVSLKGSAQGLAFAGALAVRRAVSGRAELKLKWPNDLLCDDRKVCGILVERRGDWNALGIGVNVHHAQEDFPEELRVSAGSLEGQTGQSWDRARLLGDILQILDDYIVKLRRGDFAAVHAEWAAACDLVGKTVSREGCTGLVLALDESGALLLETPEGLEVVASGVLTLV